MRAVANPCACCRECEILKQKDPDGARCHEKGPDQYRPARSGQKVLRQNGYASSRPARWPPRPTCRSARFIITSAQAGTGACAVRYFNAQYWDRQDAMFDDPELTLSEKWDPRMRLSRRGHRVRLCAHPPGTDRSKLGRRARRQGRSERAHGMGHTRHGHGARCRAAVRRPGPVHPGRARRAGRQRLHRRRKPLSARLRGQACAGSAGTAPGRRPDTLAEGA